jgi:NAD(P)-dependent dehydrogenase (short-subunit alcohol dehydrogenase family)
MTGRRRLRRVARWKRIDVLHNIVGVKLAGGYASPLEITQATFDRITAISLRGAIMASRHMLAIMRA